jgi:hypothetical protein
MPDKGLRRAARIGHRGRLRPTDRTVGGHRLGLALGGKPADTFARWLMVPANRDTMLRTMRRRARSWAQTLSVVGINDWAFRRGYC